MSNLILFFVSHHSRTQYSIHIFALQSLYDPRSLMCCIGSIDCRLAFFNALDGFPSDNTGSNSFAIHRIFLQIFNLLRSILRELYNIYFCPEKLWMCYFNLEWREITNCILNIYLSCRLQQKSHWRPRDHQLSWLSGCISVQFGLHIPDSYQSWNKSCRFFPWNQHWKFSWLH